MGRPPCCDKANVKKGPWTAEEDAKLLAYTSTHGTGNWTSVPQRAGRLKRCGKSCRLRYTNYLRPNLKHENFTHEEEELIVTLHAMLGSRWSLIANQLPGRTDNDVKNYWNTKLSKKLRQRGIDPITHRPIADLMQSIGTLAIRPPPAAGVAAYLPASPASSAAPPPPCLPVFHDAPYFAALQHQQQQVVTHVDADAPASPDQQHLQLNWSDFLADDAAGAALAGHGADAPAPQAALGQYQEGTAAMTGVGGSRAFGDVDGASGAGVGGADDGAGAASAFIDAILDCDKEMGMDQLIAEMLADPAYYGGGGGSSSLELGWGC
uniref:Uncharacterized protein n=1 Tax=Oryza punctata TaxID=4537 RepID=A0A0E0KCH7_ORYPU